MDRERELSQGAPNERRQQANAAEAMVRIVEAGQGSNLRVVPGKRWALHFPENASRRDAKLAELMSGQSGEHEDGNDLRPDALIYSAGDVEKAGADSVAAQVRDLTTQIKYYDYQQLAQFVRDYRTSGLGAEQLVSTYNRIAKARVQQKMLDAFGYTGRKQLETAMRQEMERATAGLPNDSKLERVLTALKSDWMAYDTKTIPVEQHTKLVRQLSDDERRLFGDLRDSYRRYVRAGSEQDFAQFLDDFRPVLSRGEPVVSPAPTPAEQAAPEQAQSTEAGQTDQQDPGGSSDESMPTEGTPPAGDDARQPPDESRPGGEEQNGQQLSESGQQLAEELKDLLDKIPPPGDPGDPAIAPEDKDEYHTPPPAEAGQETQLNQKRTYFTIEPRGTSQSPLGGYFISGRKSYFDPQTLTWSKRKQLSIFIPRIGSDARQALSGSVDAGVVSLPIPNGYTLDPSSFKGNGRLKRDQNGCFYIESPTKQAITVEFAPERTPYSGPPIAEDTRPLTQTPLSQDAQEVLGRARGSNIDKAVAVCAYVRSRHFYPGGGDLKMAQALQYKLRTESDAQTYIRNLEQSEYLECYSANTLFIHMVRSLGIPARLVLGHHIDKETDGKTLIDSTTGHGWSEIWDGVAWRRLDATPPPKPGEKRADDTNSPGDRNESSPSQQAQDGGLESPKTQAEQTGETGDQSGEGQPGQGQDATNQESEADQQGQNSDGQGQASQDQPGQSEKGQPSQQQTPGQSSPENASQQQPGQSSQPGQRSPSQNQPGEGQSSPNNTPEQNQPAGQDIASDEELAQGQQQLQQSQELVDQMRSDKQSMQDKLQQSQSFEQLEQLKKDADDSDLSDNLAEQLKDLADAKAEQMKKELEDKLNEMTDDGFLDEARRDQLQEKIEEGDARELDRIMEEVTAENRLYDQYEQIKDEVQPEVDKWFRYFAERLPRREEIDVDTDSLSRQGSFNRHSIMRPRNLLYGTVKNPRVFHDSVEPKFLASIVLDVSGSMQGTKLKNATKLLVFYNELFSRISEEFGYIRSAINIFSDNVTDIKGFDQDYASPQRYQFLDGSQSTVKLRLMQSVQARGGTNMLDAIQEASRQLNEEVRDYPDYASAMYFVGDGEDTCGNTANIRAFLQTTDQELGFGDHMLSAIFLGNEQQRSTLAGVFGDDKTTVAPDLTSLIEQSMLKFDDDIEAYLRDKAD